MTWIHSGEYCRCGQCCDGTSPWARRADLDSSDPMLQIPMIAGICPLFEFHGDQASCIGHEHYGYYLMGYNVWPNHPKNIADKPGCSYGCISN